jgi:hypothetical protein
LKSGDKPPQSKKSGVKPPQSKKSGFTAMMIQSLWGEGLN